MISLALIVCVVLVFGFFAALIVGLLMRRQ